MLSRKFPNRQSHLNQNPVWASCAITAVLACSLFLVGCQAPASQASGLAYSLVTKKDSEEVMTEKTDIRTMLSPESLPSDALPSDILLSETMVSIWEKEKKQEKNGTVYLYLPEMDTGRMAYAIARFSKDKMVDFHVNEASLAGTKWHAIWEAKIKKMMGEPVEPPLMEVAEERSPDEPVPIRFVE